MSSKISGLREFGNFRLDAERKVLWFAEKPVNLALKEIEMLCVLTENGGEVVTKDELLNRVWADSFVEESNLSRHIYILRKTFKDFGAGNLIETVPCRGYRFAVEVRESENGNGKIIIERHALTRTLIEEVSEPFAAADNFPAEVESPESKVESKTNVVEITPPLRVAAMAILLVALIGGFAAWQTNRNFSGVSAMKIKSIAVLPFSAIDANKENAHQGLGLADVLITRLSNVKEITVRPTSAILPFENGEQDSAGLGQKLQTDAVLEGTIYRTNDKIRVTTRLLRVSDSSTIWTGQFEKLFQDELKLQDEIALQVVSALALNLSGNEKNALTKNYTENADAFQLYQKGRYEWNKRSWAGMIEAQKSFRAAIDKDPNFALAYAGLADTLAMNSDTAETIEAIQKALELDPNLAEVYASSGFMQTFLQWNWQKAEASFKKSIELNPNYASAHHWYAQLLTVQGRHEEAKAEMRRALETNPLSYNFLADLGQIYYFNHEYREAENYCRKALEIYPDFTFAHQYLTDIYLETGRYGEAVEESIAAAKAMGTFNNQSAERQKALDADYTETRRIYAEGGIEKFLRIRIEADPQNPHVAYGHSRYFALIGEREKSLEYLEKAFAGRGFATLFLKADPIFDRLRDEPRFREILRKMNLY